MVGPEPLDLGWLAALSGGKGVALVGRGFAARTPQPAGSDLRVYPDLAAIEPVAGGDPAIVVTDEEETFRELLCTGAGGRAIYVGQRQFEACDSATRFSFVSNPDGTVRWLFRAGSRDTAYLELYTPNSSRGKLYKTAVRAVVRCGLGERVTSGSFYAGFSDIDLVARWLGQTTGFDTVAIFSGTRGLDRKVVIALGRGGAVTHFLKVPLGAGTRAMLETEFSVLNRIGGDLGPHVVVPTVSRGEGGAVLIENVRPSRSRSGLDVTRLHVGFLSALYSRYARVAPLGETATYRELDTRIDRLRELDLPARDGFAEKGRTICALAEQLFVQIPTAEYLPVSLAHADFTPWNVFEGERSLHVYDWELAREAPLLSDLFHFVCQGSVLVRKEPPDRIIERLKKEVARRTIRALVQRYGTDANLHLRLYLLDKATYYLERYARQGDLHRQAHWLLDFWSEALQRCMREPRLLPDP